MKYYVVADVHGFYTELCSALDEAGFFADTEPRKLIVCGDLLDRGSEAVKLQAFALDLLKRGELIFVRGNHEDLIAELAEHSEKWLTPDVVKTHHWHNGTVDSLLQLTDMDLISAILYPERLSQRAKATPYFKRVLPQAIDYYETARYIFVHGWIPCNASGYGGRASSFAYSEGWRNAESIDWLHARWYNGMEAARQGVIEPNKTIVCGHYHCSYGHAIIEGRCSELGEDADFSPYMAKGIIALDACTAHSHKINCIVVEDEPLSD